MERPGLRSVLSPYPQGLQALRMLQDRSRQGQAIYHQVQAASVMLQEQLKTSSVRSRRMKMLKP